MCYDISFNVNVRELADYFPDLVFDEQIEIDFNSAVHIVGHSHGKHPIIYLPLEQVHPHCRLMEWGCIPFYVKEEEKFKKQRATMLNARSERILGDEKSYWYKIRNRRCLLPMNGMYEHRAIKGWKNKVPYFISLQQQNVFFIPGLYSVVELPDKETGEVIKRYTYTLITRDANSVMRMIHNSGDNRWRMPLYITLEMANKWLMHNLQPDDYKNILDYELPSKELKYHPVFSIRGKNNRADDKAKNEFYDWPNLPELIENDEL